MWDKHRWWKVDQGSRWMSDTPLQMSAHEHCPWGRVVGFVRLVPVVEGRVALDVSPFTVFSVHLSVAPEAVKWHEIARLKEIVDEVAGDVSKDFYVVAGDFNLFDDEEGGEQRAWLEKHFTNAGKNAVYSQSRQPAVRTFFPYAYEREYRKLLDLNSLLDHVFLPLERALVTSAGRQSEVCTSLALVDDAGEPIEEPPEFSTIERERALPPGEYSDGPVFPSDHLLLSVPLSLTFKSAQQQSAE